MSSQKRATSATHHAVDGVAELLRVLVAEAVRDAVGVIKDEIRATLAAELRARSEAQSTPCRLLTVGDVADRLNVRPATVREWIRSGHLAAVPIGPAGRRYGIRAADLESVLEKRAGGTKVMDSGELAIQIVKCARKRARGRKE